MDDDKEKIKELFATWLAKNAPSAHLSDLFLCYSEIEAFCLKTKVLQKPLFETTDVETVRMVQKKVTESRIFHFYHKNQMKKIDMAARYYTAFVKEMNETSIPSAVEISEKTLSSSHNENLANDSSLSPTIKDEACINETHVDPLIAFLEERQLEYVDCRNKNGCLWIMSKAEDVLHPLINAGVSLHFKAEGGNVTGGKPAWWTKDDTSHLQLTESNLASTPPEAETSTNTVSTVSTAFDAFFEEEKYKMLYKELKEEGINSLDALKEINLWSFMNMHQLYSIQQRVAISTELTAKLRSEENKDNQQATATYEVHYNGTTYKGSSPSKAFVAFLAAIAAKYPLKFRSLLDIIHPATHKVVISRRCGAARLRMMNPDAYVDHDLSLEQVKLYVAWVLDRCGALPKAYSVTGDQKDIEVPDSNPPITPEQPVNPPVASPYRFLAQKAEEYLLQCDLAGATYDELQSKLHCTMVATKEIAAKSLHIIEMNKKLYHEDALVDFEEGADALEAILDKLVKKNNGIATAKHLYEYARSEMAMFFNDNGITDQQSVYDLARHLFEKLKYHGKQYVFRYNLYISLPGVSADSVLDFVKKYAREKESTIKLKEVEDYLIGMGMKASNVRMLMKIDKEPIFLVYAENEYLLAELMHIDVPFLESIRRALHHLFADADGHIIPRNISDSWYNLLPTLPASLSWTPLLLQQLIRFYPNELEARTIIAMETQSSNTLHAMFVEKGSWIQDFRDVVAVFLHDEIPDRSEFEAEELRKILVEAGMISGNQLIWHMHIALGGDPRFLWSSDNSCVKVRL